MFKNFLTHGALFKQDDPPGGSGAGDQGGEDATGGDGQSPEKQRVVFTPEQQVRIDSLMDGAYKRGAEKATAEATEAQQKREAAAEEERLQKQREFEQLAGQRAEKIVALEASIATMAAQIETLTADRDAYKGVTESYLEQQRAGLPDHIIALLDKLEPIEQLSFLAENADKLTKSTGAGLGSPRSTKTGIKGDQKTEKQPGIGLPRL